jgi:uncharacterized protein YutE (UPF0331/DUF86 family)
VVVPPKVAQLLEHLAQYVRALQRLAALAPDELLADQDKLASAKNHFVVAIEVCIDVGNHVIAAGGFRAPRDNADTFAVLCENGLLPQVDLEKYRAMARFRNRLVHLYWEVDDSLVVDYLQSSVADLEHFARAITRSVDLEPGLQAGSLD